MEIDIRHVAKLARLKIEEDQLEGFEKELTAIVHMVEKLPPLTGADALLDEKDTMALREDKIEPSCPREEILSNAPSAAEGYFVVPKTVE